MCVCAILVILCLYLAAAQNNTFWNVLLALLSYAFLWAAQDRRGILLLTVLGYRPLDSESKPGSLNVCLMLKEIYQFTLTTVHSPLSLSLFWSGLAQRAWLSVLPYAGLTWVVAVVYGAQRGARTHDPEIKSLMLYQLS